MVLAIAAEMDREVRQLDVKTAFLYADIEEDVFVAKPPGFETQGKNGVPFLLKLGKLYTGWLKAPGIGSTQSIPYLSRSDLFR